MDALILSCSTGGGHNAAGEAILQELQHRGHSARMLDPYTLTNGRLDSHVGQSYVNLVKHAPRAFGVLYSMGNAYRKLPIHSPVYHLNGKMAPLMEQFFRENHFDAVISTHIFPAQILASMKEKGMTVPKSVLVATDYTCIPFTEESCCDWYVVPSQDLTEEFSHWGIPQKKILPLGIPVSRAFFPDMSRQEKRELACNTLGLDSQEHYLLLSSGSMGAGNLSLTIELLLKHFTPKDHIKLIVVCGSNHKLYEKLSARYQEKLLLVGHTNQMADYMNACDFILTKPGGLSSTEAAVSGTPMIHLASIPGCESHNLDYFEHHGMSLGVRNPLKELIPAVEKLRSSAVRQRIRDNQSLFVSPHAAHDICDLVEQIC